VFNDELIIVVDVGEGFLFLSANRLGLLLITVWVVLTTEIAVSLIHLLSRRVSGKAKAT
jgi:hypothetical protein